MIIAKLYGGMGNQMFQYAFARALSLKNNIPFTIDKSFLSRRDMYEGFVYRDYDLDLFNIEENFIDNTEQIVHINESIFNTLSAYFCTLFCRMIIFIFITILNGTKNRLCQPS